MNWEGVRVKQAELWATDSLKHSKMMTNQHHRPLSSTTRLEKHTQLTTGLPWCHEYSRLLVQIARGPRISSQQKQTSYHRPCLTLKSNSAFMQLCIVCVKNFDFLSWAIRPFLSDLVTYSSRAPFATCQIKIRVYYITELKVTAYDKKPSMPCVIPSIMCYT